MDEPWKKIFDDHCSGHDFEKKPFVLTAEMIKKSTKKFKKTGEREVRILAKMDSREELPSIFIEKGLFLLPVKNGTYVIIKGEGFHDIETIESPVEQFKSRLGFELKSAKIGDSEMQHLDFAFNCGLIEHFTGAGELYLQIRGRKYAPKFSFHVGPYLVEIESVQTEVDAGYEGAKIIVLIEAKSSKQRNIIIRQLYYPYRQWKTQTGKDVTPLFFSHDHKSGVMSLWEYAFSDELDYNSIKLVKSGRFLIKE